MKPFKRISLILLSSVLVFSCDEEVNTPDEKTPENFRLKKYVISSGDIHSGVITYETDKYSINEIVEYSDGDIYNNIYEYYLDENGNVEKSITVYEGYCNYTVEYKYSSDDVVIKKSHYDYNNYPDCQLDDTQSIDYHLNEEGIWEYSISTSTNSTNKDIYKYNIQDGNIIEVYDSLNNNFIKETFSHDLTKKIPSNLSILRGVVSGNDDWVGENLLVEHSRFESEQNFYKMKNEYEFDEFNNILKITLLRLDDENMEFSYWYTIDLTYEEIY